MTAFEERAPHEAGFAAVFEEEVLPLVRGRAEAAERRRLQSIGIGFAIFIVGVALAVVSLMAFGENGIIPAFFAAGIGVLFGFALPKQLRLAFDRETRGLVGPVLARFMGIDKYDVSPKDDWLDLDVIRGAGIVQNFNRVRLQDGIAGRWRDVGYQMAEARLIRRQSSSSGSGGSSSSSTRDIFRGLIVQVETPTDMPWIVFIDSQGSVTHGAQGAKFAQPLLGAMDRMVQSWEFPSSLQEIPIPGEGNAPFKLFSDDPDAARAAITPAFGHTLRAVAEAGSEYGKLAALFRGRMFCAALPLKRDFFPVATVGKTEDEIAEACRDALRDLLLPRTLIDLLIDGPQAVSDDA